MYHSTPENLHICQLYYVRMKGFVHRGCAQKRGPSSTPVKVKVSRGKVWRQLHVWLTHISGALKPLATLSGDAGKLLMMATLFMRVIFTLVISRSTTNTPRSCGYKSVRGIVQETALTMAALALLEDITGSIMEKLPTLLERDTARSNLLPVHIQVLSTWASQTRANFSVSWLTDRDGAS